MIIRDVTKFEFNRYRKVQHSGVTNMMDVRRVCALTRLERGQVIWIMENYKDLEIVYGDFDE